MTTVAAAPSDIWDALPAVTMPLAANAGLELRQRGQARVAARALVGVEAIAASAAVGARSGQRHDLVLEPAGVDGGERLLVRAQREGVGVARGRCRTCCATSSAVMPMPEVAVGIALQQRRVGRDLVPAHGDQAHRLRARRPPPRRRVRLGWRRRASAMACSPEEQKRLIVMAAGRDGDAGEQAGDARDVHALLGLGHGAAEDHVVDHLRLRRPARAPRAPWIAGGGHVVGPGLRASPWAPCRPRSARC